MMPSEISLPNSSKVCLSNTSPKVFRLKTARSNSTWDCRSSFFNHLSLRSSSEDINFLWKHFPSAQAARLSPTIPKNNICFLILDVPWFNDEQVTSAHPGFPFHFPGDSSHPGFLILADDMDSRSTEELVCDCVHLIVLTIG